MTTRLDPGLIDAVARSLFAFDRTVQLGHGSNYTADWGHANAGRKAHYRRKAIIAISAADDWRFGRLLDRVNAEPVRLTRWERLAAGWRRFRENHLVADDPWDAETQADKKDNKERMTW